MKKQGSALVVVLLTLTALLITGVAVYSYIVNTSKLNNNEMQKESIQTAAMSALNIGEYYLIDKEKYKDIPSGDSININKSDIESLLSDNNFNDVKNINEDDRLSSSLYDYNIILKNNGDGNYKVEAKVKKNNSEITKDSTVKIKINNGISLFNALDNNIIGMFNILNGNDFSIYNSNTIINNASYNFYNMKDLNSLPSDLKYADNLNPDNKKINSLNLRLKKGNISINNFNQLINRLENHVIWEKSYKIILINGDYETRGFESIGDAKDEFKNYSAALIKLNDDVLNADWHDSYLLVCNGNLDLKSMGQSYYGLEGDELFIYSNGNVDLNEVNIGKYDYVFTNDNVYMSIVAKEGINIEDSNIYVKGSFRDISNNLKNVLEKFTK